jgi:hypothetical protein
LPLRFLFIVHVALDRLVNGEAGGGGDVELATAAMSNFGTPSATRTTNCVPNTIIETVIGIFGLSIGPTPSRRAEYPQRLGLDAPHRAMSEIEHFSDMPRQPDDALAQWQRLSRECALGCGLFADLNAFLKARSVSLARTSQTSDRPIGHQLAERGLDLASGARPDRPSRAQIGAAS